MCCWQTDKQKQNDIDMLTCQSLKSHIIDYCTEKLITSLMLKQFLDATLH